MAERIAAVETYYNGIKYRSRLEARWQVFFDVLDIEARYEPEKFATSAGRYIPDFDLPSVVSPSSGEGLYFEAKGIFPNEIEARKAAELCDRTGKFVAVFYGDMAANCGTWPYIGHADKQLHCDTEEPLRWFQCPLCGVLGVGHARTGKRACDPLSHFCRPQAMIGLQYDIDPCFLDYCCAPEIQWHILPPMLSCAFEAAKSARFEDPEFRHQIAAWKRSVAHLRELRVFSSSEVLLQIYQAAARLSQDPHFPRYQTWDWLEQQLAKA